MSEKSTSERIVRRRFASPLRLAPLALGAASFLSVNSAEAQYVYVPSSNATGRWEQAARWTGGPAGSVPNAIDATAILNLPLQTTPSAAYNLQLSNTAGSNFTVGSLTVNNSPSSLFNTRIGANGNGTLTFQVSSGTAFYIENDAASTFTTNIFAPVIFASDTILTQNHAVTDNTGTQFDSTANSPGGITGASGITLTKNGLGNTSFTVAPSAPGTGFLGNLVVDAGAVRQTANVFGNAASATVHDGGQFQLASSSIANWHLAPGAILTLNGLGKDSSTVNYQGALRFQNNAASASFDNEVHLASDAGIFVNANLTPTPPNPVTFGQLTLSQVVSGEGELNKLGGGVLNLLGDNTYSGGTDVVAGTLRVSNTSGSATGTGAVTVQAGATLAGGGSVSGPVSFVGGILSPGDSPGTIQLGSTTFDAGSILKYELDAAGVVGGGVNDLTVVAGDLTLDGLLDVTALSSFGEGVYRLFDYSGVLTDNGLEFGSLPEGFSYSIDTSIASQVNLQVQAVPEASTLALASAGAVGLAVLRRRNRRPHPTAR
jgi:autotransporter-associated beta strand protein